MPPRQRHAIAAPMPLHFARPFCIIFLYAIFAIFTPLRISFTMPAFSDICACHARRQRQHGALYFASATACHSARDTLPLLPAQRLRQPCCHALPRRQLRAQRR